MIVKCSECGYETIVRYPYTELFSVMCAYCGISIDINKEVKKCIEKTFTI